MITAELLYPIGYVVKTHGVKGELNISLDTDFDPGDFRFLVFDIDSIFVPFKVISSRGKSEDNKLVTLEDVDTVEEAREFTGKTAYILKRELENHPDYDETEDEGIYLSDLIGFNIFDEDGNDVGTIIGYNDDTQNYLLEVKLPDGREVFVPYVDEWLVDFDRDRKIIKFSLPKGLID